MIFTKWLESKQISIWLDDERDPNEPKYQIPPFNANSNMIWVKSVAEAKELLKNGNVSFISFDNDLGLSEEGRHLASWIEEQAYNKSLPPLKWAIHSQNVEGRRQITMAMNSAERFWNNIQSI